MPIQYIFGLIMCADGWLQWKSFKCKITAFYVTMFEDSIVACINVHVFITYVIYIVYIYILLTQSFMIYLLLL